MKALFRSSLFLMMIVSLFSFSFVSCGDDDDTTTTPANKTALNALITQCDSLLLHATTDDYPQTAIDAFTTTLTSVKQAAASPTLTQQQADNLVVSLTEAKNLFLASAYDAIPATAMLLSFDFNTPNDVELTAAGAKQLKAKLMTGPSEIFGTNTEKPTFIDGVKGGKAMHFAKGGHLEIQEFNHSDFLSNTLSIAVWVKPDSTRAGNYIASLNYWNNWKLNLQKDNKPFFTVQTSVGGPVDVDNEAPNSAPNGSWTHLVVSLDLTANSLSFYVNGEATKTWNNTNYPGLSGSMAPAFTTSIPFMIGAATTYADANTAWTWGDSWKNPAEWDYFAGAMDNFSIYNVALTDGQVSKLYNEQKP